MAGDLRLLRMNADKGIFYMAVGLLDADLKSVNRKRADVMVFIGVDLGKVESHSAFVIVERFEEWPGRLRRCCEGRVRGGGMWCGRWSGSSWGRSTGWWWSG